FSKLVSGRWSVARGAARDSDGEVGGGVLPRDAGAVQGGLGRGQVAFADREAVKGLDFMAAFVTSRPGREVVFEVFPGVAALIITRTERAARIITAMDHAIFAARIARFAVHNAVFVPLHFLQHFPVTGVMAVG